MLLRPTCLCTAHTLPAPQCALPPRIPAPAAHMLIGQQVQLPRRVGSLLCGRGRRLCAVRMAAESQWSGAAVRSAFVDFFKSKVGGVGWARDAAGGGAAPTCRWIACGRATPPPLAPRRSIPLWPARRWCR